jgi:GrpB-like predicted nucleotidyltransferase (UPF0157 family)
MIIVEDYNVNWKNEFYRIRDFLRTVITGFEITHVGSTSVEGLAAKPIIDLVILVPEEEQEKVIVLLEALGYSHRWYLGIEGRHAFKGNDYIQNEFMRHHLYVGDKECDSIKNFLLLKDFLKKNNDYIVKYSNLKKENAEKYTDIDLYVEAKSDLIREMLQKAGMSEDALEAIFQANKAK